MSKIKVLGPELTASELCRRILSCLFLALDGLLAVFGIPCLATAYPKYPSL